VDDRTFHVVGVCEDAESFRLPPEAIDPSGPHSWNAKLLPMARSSSQTSETRLSSGTTAGDGDVSLSFWPLKSGYPIEECSAGLTVLSGPLMDGAKLSHWLSGSSSEALVANVQHILNHWHRSRTHLPRHIAKLRLKPPHMVQIGCELVAAVELTMNHNIGKDHNSWTVRAVLSDVKKVKKRERSRHSPTASQSSMLGRRSGERGTVLRRPLAEARAAACAMDHDQSCWNMCGPEEEEQVEEDIIEARACADLSNVPIGKRTGTCRSSCTRC
jgi:hypothetical protein